MMLDDLSARYIRLAFGIERHIPGFVDAYTGSASLRTEALAGRPLSPDTLLAEAQALAALVAEVVYPQRRREYLGAQLRALVFVCRKLAGEPLDYREEVQGCFDIEPVPIPEAVFEDAMADLDTLLPGTGSLAERMQQWRRRYTVAPATARDLIITIAAEARRRTYQLLNLPEGEEVTVELVSDKPWSGYNWYLGNYRSRVEVNTDLPLDASTLTSLMCHEAYPGHHTEHVLKEQLLFHEHGYGEHAIQLIGAPECVISEGIAMLAESVIFPHDELYHWQTEVLYRQVGITGDAQAEARLALARQTLRGVLANAALLLHAEGASEAEVVAYLGRYGLRNEEEARHSLRFIADPLWRAYVFTYHSGHQLLGRWLAMGDASTRYRMLLTEQVYPSLIEGWSIQERLQCPG